MVKPIEHPSDKEKALLKELDHFFHKIEVALYELHQNPDIRDVRVELGFNDPQYNGQKLKITAIGKITTTEKLMGYARYIPRNN